MCIDMYVYMYYLHEGACVYMYIHMHIQILWRSLECCLPAGSWGRPLLRSRAPHWGRLLPALEDRKKASGSSNTEVVLMEDEPGAGTSVKKEVKQEVTVEEECILLDIEDDDEEDEQAEWEGLGLDVSDHDIDARIAYLERLA